MNHHRLHECSEGIVTCKWSSHGCKISEKRSSLCGHEDTCVYAAIAKLSTEVVNLSNEVSNLKEARVNDKTLISLLLEGRAYDLAEIKQLKDTLALRPGVGVRDANDNKTCSASEGFQRQLKEETVGALGTMATRMAAMDSALESVVPALENVVHKHELYAMHTDLLNRLRQVDMRLHHLDRSRRVPEAKTSFRETNTTTVDGTNAAQPQPRQRQQQDADSNAPVRGPAQHNASTGLPSQSFYRIQPDGHRFMRSEVLTRRRSIDGQRNEAPKL
jgi:hypothetical protein